MKCEAFINNPVPLPPPAFLARMQALLGDEFPAFLASYEEPAAAGLRVNTLKMAAQDFATISPYLLKPVSLLHNSEV